MKVLIAGDIHASRYHLRYLFDVAKDNGAELIIALGDFCFFPKKQWSLDFLDTASQLAVDTGIPLYWLDGNHEDHDELAIMTNGSNSDKFLTRYEDKVWDGVWYLPRGYRFEVDGVSFMSYGGAYSVDRQYRTKNISWFPREVIELSHIESLSDERVDILLTHDVPFGYSFPYDETLPDSVTSAEQRRHLLQLVYKTKPFLCFGGHHHMRRTYGVHHATGKTECHILNMNNSGNDSWVLLDTEQFHKVFH